MKTIEDAVIELGGKWPSKSSLCIYMHRFESEKVWECSSSSFGALYSKEQFESAAKRMANKPSWDDAPENANYLIQDTRGRWNWCVDVQLNSPSGTVMIGVNPACVGHLFGENKDTLEARPSKKSPLNKNERCSMNEKESNWHERGELPPIGVECEVFSKLKGWVGCKILAHGNCRDNGRVAFWQAEHDCGAFWSPEKFRPIRTHREKVIEAAVMVCTGVNIPTLTDGLTMKTLNKLYDAGMLVLPQESSDTKD